MRHIYLGYATDRSAREILKFFDYDEEHPEGLSLFEQTVGQQPMNPQGFEAYDRDMCAQNDIPFNHMIFNAVSPFDISDQTILDQIDFANAKSVFFIETPAVKAMQVEDIHFVGPLKVKYDWD